MKNSVLAVGLFALLLSACSDAQTKAVLAPPVAMNIVPINVDIVNGQIDVPDEQSTYPMHKKVAWTIINPDLTYTFPNKGIVFQDPGLFNCRLQEHDTTNRTFECDKIEHRKGKHKYEINVKHGANLLHKDPYIHNR